jgi:N-acetylglutamate synthase-like GNAT family acetyltransferase
MHVVRRQRNAVPTLISIHAPASPETLAIVDAGLDEYSVAGGPLHEVKALHVIATDHDGSISGGAVGRTWGKCCELQQLWVASEYRGRKEGTRLMDAFELEATQRGCEFVYLDTFSFQAPEFYIKRGYVEVFRTTGFAGEVTKSTMQKHLAGSVRADA